jgi:YidC/Oxa1 family membrane protein insertase
MNVWTIWLDAIRSLVEMLSSGVGLGFAVIVATLLLRATVLPISWSIAYRGCIRQKKMARMQPELQRIKEQFADKPDMYFKHMQALYGRNGLSFFDGKSLLGSLIQTPLLLGMFQTLRNIGNGVRFLWVPNLLKPDLALAIIAGITTALMMMVNPDLPEPMRVILIVVPSIIAVVAALKFCSALSLYWATSNCFTAIQTMVLHFVVGRRVRSGVLKI